MAASLVRWNAGAGGTALTAVSDQLGNATQAAGLRLYTAMRLACSKLATAVSAAKAGPSIPDASLQGWYARALATLTQAAAYCQAGISVHPYGDEDTVTHQNGAMLSRSASAFATGAGELYRATAEIRALP
jgi:hypothetical protein